MDIENIHTDGECEVLLRKIFKNYPAFLKKHLPKGWKDSECVKFFHPTAEQQFEEHKNIAGRLKELSKEKKSEKEYSLSDFKQDFSDLDEEKEPITLLGLCLWDIFSNNHSVVDDGGKEYNLGSFRGSAGFIAEMINGKGEPGRFGFSMDYMEFYMGTIWIKNRGDVLPFYEYIFNVLRKEGCDWKYSFPRLGLVNFRKDEPLQPEEYSPEKALERELKDKEVSKLQEEFDRMHDEEYEEAKYKEPPKTVLAYRKVYGALPDGHPQKDL